jgi:hypothetical protein
MIKIIEHKLSQTELTEFCTAHFETLVKFVADISQDILAVGGELHADAEAMLLDQGSRQSDLWGGNFYPWNPPDQRIEFTSFINIRPADENASMEVLDGDVRGKIVHLVENLLLSPAETMAEGAS